MPLEDFMNFEVKYVKLSNGETIAYRKSGKGNKHCILIHGNYCSSVAWLGILERFSQEYTMYAPDLRGFGNSSYVNRARELNVYAEDVIELINILGLDEVYIMGWSAGGGVAMEIAAALEERVKLLILVSSISTRGYRSDYSVPLAMTKLARFMFPVPMYFLDSLNLFQRVSDMTKDRKELGLYLDTLLFNRTKPTPEFREQCIDALLLQRNNMDYWEAMTNFNITNSGDNISVGSRHIEEITAPVVVMQGIYDKIVPYKDARQIVTDFGEQANLISFKSSGHCIFLDEERKFDETLRWAMEKDFTKLENLDVS